MAAGIFISYRRQGELAHARAVYERLRAEFGAAQVFIDLEGLAIGEDFVAALQRQLALCRVMLVLIGPQWLQARDSQGRRRLDQPQDFVRLEVATALARQDVRVVPLLIDGTGMPGDDDLPADLRPLLRRQALSLRFASFDADVRHLVAGLRSVPALWPPAVPGLSTRPAWASDEGADIFGRWAEFTVAGVVQRLRWLPPGAFLMGSPADEPGRVLNEGPQHQVRLTRGLWLADTACTQALWLAVLGGDNPSRFQQHPNCPVDQVSHRDAERFLARLRGRLGAGAEPVLPTEAQWEYACRAGSTTAFGTGAQISTSQANFDGGPAGPSRGCTVAVKSLPPNRWGLFEMHGNVWEWCADGGLRRYQALAAGQSADDPLQPGEPGRDGFRAVRGGGFADPAKRLRSACRDRHARGLPQSDLGFRLALRPQA